jgi:hypothetical protein
VLKGEAANENINKDANTLETPSNGFIFIKYVGYLKLIKLSFT